MTDIWTLNGHWIAMIAELFATIALSALMALKQARRVMPKMDIIGMISGMTGVPRVAGWIMHLLIGAVLYGGAFFGLQRVIPGPFWTTELLLGVIGWLMATVVMMPMPATGSSACGWDRWRRSWAS